MHSWQFTPIIELDMVIRLLIAAVAGGVIGYERERAVKPAGLRTNILVCTGAALFTILSSNFGGISDPSRIAAAVVIGVGFLGAGTIFRMGERTIGLTTAATVWVVAAIGLALGAGFYPVGLFAAILAYITLRLPHPD